MKSQKRKVATRHNPLHVDLLKHAGAHVAEVSTERVNKGLQDDQLENYEDVVPKGLSKRILRLVDRQQRGDL